MKNTILLLLGGLISGIIIVYLKNFISKKFKKEVSTLLPEHFSTAIDNITSDIKKVEDKIKSSSIVEEFSGKKLLTGMTKVNSLTLWAKEFSWIFNLRKLIIVGVILGVIFGYGWYKGKTEHPATINLDYGKEIIAPLNKEHNLWLHITKDGSVHVQDNQNDKIAHNSYVIKVKDIPELAKELRPYGLDLEPFVTAGGSVGTTPAQVEAGIGIQLAHWYKMNFSPFITNVGLYPLGLGYRITENSDILLGYGIGYSGDTRYYLGMKFKF
jgi:hypothetical protein